MAERFAFISEDELHSKGLSNQADVELDMINVLSVADVTLILSCQVHKLL